MASAKTSLRAVAPDEKAPAAPPETIRAAVGMDERAFLVAAREKVAATIDGGVQPAYLAPLFRQLRDFDREVRALDARAEREQAKGERATDAAFDSAAV